MQYSKDSPKWCRNRRRYQGKDGYFGRMTNSMPRTGEHNDNSNLLRGIRLPAFPISFYVGEEPFLCLIEKDNLLNVCSEMTGTYDGG